MSIRKGIFCVCFIGTLLITGAKEIKAETSHASWYGPQHHGRMMASGFRFDMHTLVVAHRTHRFGTLIRLTRHTRENRELSVVVRVCDRGPYVAGRTLDVSYAAARVLEFDRAGTALLRVEILYSPRSTEEVREARASCGTPLFLPARKHIRVSYLKNPYLESVLLELPRNFATFIAKLSWH